MASHLIFFFYFGSVVLPMETKSDSPSPPDRWLSEYRVVDSIEVTKPDDHFYSEQNFKDDFISKNGTNFIFNEDVTTIDFSCEAAYPIKWKFPQPEQLHDIDLEQIHSREYRTSEIITDSLQPVNIRYIQIIRMNIAFTKFLSVELTCVSTEFGLESGVHIFLQGKSVIEKAGTTIKVFKDDTSNIRTDIMPIILPCRPATPDIQLRLEYQASKESFEKNTSLDNVAIQKSWMPLNLTSNNINYDPKQGFVLKSGFEHKPLFGIYRCSVVGEDDNNIQNYVFINVTKTSDPSYFTNVGSPFPMHASMSLDFPKHLQKTSNVRVVNYYGENGYPMHEITCCSDAKHSPLRLYNIPCNNPFECQLAKKSIYDEIYSGDFQNLTYQLVNDSKDCYREFLFATCHVVVCKSGNDSYQDYFANLFHAFSHSSVTNRSQLIFGTTPPNEKYSGHNKLNFSQVNVFALARYEDSTSAQNAPETQLILLLVGFRSESWPELEDLGPHAGFSFSEIFEEYDEFGFFKGYYNEIDDLQWSQNNVFLLEYNRDVYYEGEPLVFMCFGVRFFFARGSHLLINWKNGTRSSVKLKNRYAMSLIFLTGKTELFEGDSQSNTVHTFGNEVVARQEMESVECWLPRNNNEKWEKALKPLKVLPSVPPRLLEKKVEVVGFNLGDVNKNVTCTVIEGLPQPIVEVTRNGVEQKIRRVTNGEKLEPGQESSRLLNTLKTDFVQPQIQSIIGKDGANIVTIMFSTINLEDQGEFCCIVKNTNKTIFRTIKIIVTEKPSTWTHISLGGVGIGFLLFTGLVIWYKRKKIRNFLTEA